MFWFDYALIRYMPNPKRGETINVGLVIFRESGVDVRVVSSPAKVRMIDGLSSLSDIYRLKESMQQLTQIVTTPTEQYRLLSSFNSGLFLSSRAQFALDELSQYEDKVNKLFSDDFNLLTETKELLAQPEQEPVAWCQLIDGKVQDLLTSFEMKDWLYDDTWIPLYLAQPKREPSASAREMYQRGYADGVRFAEKAHGITGDKK